MKLTAIILAAAILAFGGASTTTKEKDKVDKPVELSISAENAGPGEEARLKISLDKNENGISMLRGTIRSDGLIPTGVSGGYIMDKADDLLYSIEGDSILIVWGNGDGREDLKGGLGSGYPYRNTCDDFLTLTYTVPENAKDGAEYKFSFDGDITAVTGNDKTLTLSAEPCSITVLHTDAEKQESTTQGFGSESTSSTKKEKHLFSDFFHTIVSLALLLFGLIVGAAAMLFLNKMRRGSGKASGNSASSYDTNRLLEMVKTYQQQCSTHEKSINDDIESIKRDLNGLKAKK
jgi:hypothetical protein